jgi:hypothetical protein
MTFDIRVDEITELNLIPIEKSDKKQIRKRVLLHTCPCWQQISPQFQGGSEKPTDQVKCTLLELSGSESEAIKSWGIRQ